MAPTVVGASRPLAEACLNPIPDVAPEMSPGVVMISDDRPIERVLRVWTNTPQWWTDTFNLEGVTNLRALVYVREASSTGECVTCFPLRPRGVSIPIRGGMVTVSVAVWRIDGGGAVNPRDATLYASIAPGRPQFQEVLLQRVAASTQVETIRFQPDKYDGAFGGWTPTLWGMRFCDSLRVDWTSSGPGPALTIRSGSYAVQPTDLWGSIVVPVDNIVDVLVPAGQFTIVGAYARVFR